MTGWFAVIALVLITFGGLCAAIDAAYQSLSRNDVANLGNGPSARVFDAIAADVPAHLNAVNFVRVLCETFAAILGSNVRCRAASSIAFVCAIMTAGS